MCEPHTPARKYISAQCFVISHNYERRARALDEFQHHHIVIRKYGSAGVFTISRISLRVTGAEMPLTKREIEVLGWVARGKSARDIGKILKITKRTVDEHVSVAVQKLAAQNRTQAVVLALRDGIIDL
jgi:DNA-binding NarL/FixJ family response regulator